MDTIKVLKAVAEIDSIQQHAPKGNVQEKYVRNYHSVLHALEQETGHDVQEFLIPESELTQRVAGSNRNLGGGVERKYTSERYCDGEFFRIKLNASINFFRYLTQGDGKRQIGF